MRTRAVLPVERIRVTSAGIENSKKASEREKKRDPSADAHLTQELPIQTTISHDDEGFRDRSRPRRLLRRRTDSPPTPYLFRYRSLKSVCYNDRMRESKAARRTNDGCAVIPIRSRGAASANWRRAPSKYNESPTRIIRLVSEKNGIKIVKISPSIVHQGCCSS